MSTTQVTPAPADAMSDFVSKHYSDGGESAAPDSGQESSEAQVETDAADGKAGTDPAQTDQVLQAEADGGKQAGTDPAAAETGDIEALIQKFAKEMGLDPNDPAQRKTLDRVASKEAFILKQQAQIAELQAKIGGDGSDQLTEYEREQLKAEKAETAEGDGKEKPADTEPTRTAQADAPKPWRSAQELYGELAEAYQSGDFDRIHAVESRRFEFQLTNLLPALDQRMAALMEQRFGDVMPKVRESVAREERLTAQEFALAQIEKVQGFEGVRDLYKVEDGPRITLDGQEYPNTPMNRLLKEFPELMDIQGRDANETYIKRYRAAMKFQKAKQVDKAKVQTLVQSGQKLEQRAALDRARQGLNAGPGATGHGENRDDDYLQQLKQSGASRSANL